MPGQGARLVPGMPALHSIIILASAIPNWTELLFPGIGKGAPNRSVVEYVIATTGIECCTSCAALPSALQADIGFLARCTSPLCVCTWTKSIFSCSADVTAAQRYCLHHIIAFGGHYLLVRV